MDPEIASQVAAVRRFHRFYARRTGVLDRGVLNSRYSPTEARVLFELAQRGTATATGLCDELGVDAGYLSRIVRRFARAGLVERRASAADGRQRLLSLTGAGRSAAAALDGEARAEAERMLTGLTAEERRRVVAAMEAVEGVLGGAEGAPPYRLRGHAPGDIGWVVHRHGVLYHEEYGWNEEFEALVAEIAARFIRDFDPGWERCWIAERDGERVGSVFLIRHPEMPDTVAKLRLLLVEPRARGLGIGRRLVGECTRFAREVGYRRIMLWTNSVLHAARRLYQEEGYRLVREEPHRSFGHALVGQTWELEL